MKRSVSTCSGAARSPGKPEVISAAEIHFFWPVLVSSVPVLLSAIVHTTVWITLSCLKGGALPKLAHFCDTVKY